MTPLAYPSPGRRLVGRLLAIAGVLGLYALLVRYDVPLMQVRYAVVGDEMTGLLKNLMNSAREFGQLLCVIVVCILLYLLDPRGRQLVVTLLIAEGIGMALYHPAKATIARYRPQEAIEQLTSEELRQSDRVRALGTLNWRDPWIGWRPGNWDSKRQSFPSGHSAGAFILGLCLARYYPAAARLFLTLACACALSRYLDAVHWPSDCWMGAWLGVLSVWAAWAIRPPLPAPGHGRAPPPGPGGPGA